MPYKNKEDKAKQMRRYRARVKQEKQAFFSTLQLHYPEHSKQLKKKFPSFFAENDRRTQ